MENNFLVTIRKTFFGKEIDPGVYGGLFKAIKCGSFYII